MDQRRQFGNVGEELAANFLQSQGMTILASQYKKSFGEIDLICQDKDEVVFVEVKARATRTFGHPEDSVTPEKVGHILRVAQKYLEEQRIEGPWRIDVLAVEYHQVPPHITHLKNIDIPERFW
ncbi:YraN family protein [Candidatus Uhrbacteria bacterium]|nr:YraN family protein [Candidatus Uhrbacteria bacterium]